METDFYSGVYNPDVLSCIANLSNDEVFTPPEVANAMLDLLPQDLFEDPNTTFLDPACKSGVFLREIAKRLIKGLEPEIPDLQQRLDHIFHKQLFGIAITELTSLLSRRSLYCFESVNQPLVIGRLTGGKWDRARDLARRIYSRYGIAPTLTTGCSGSTIFKVISSDGRSVRSATPIEYWRLMGWKDAQIQRIIDAKTSPTQMYKQAGNSIALPVLEHLFRELYGGNHEKNSNG